MIASTENGQRLIFGLVFGLLFCVLGPADAAQEVTIRLRPTVSVEKAVFTLSQVAELSGGLSTDTVELGRIVMGNSPLPGNYLWVRPAIIEQKLRRKGIDSNRYHLVAEAPVKIIRKYQMLSKDQIESALLSFVHHNAPWQKDQMKIRPISFNGGHKLPLGQMDLQVFAPERSDWLGAEAFNVTVVVDGAIEKRFTVPLYIEVWANVVMAARSLGRGQTVRREDLLIERMDLARAPSNAVLDPGLLVGCTAKRAILVRTILRTNQFDRPPVIQKGDVVIVVAESEHLKITAKATACENGDQGERIELINLQSRKKIFALVVDHQTVKVQF